MGAGPDLFRQQNTVGIMAWVQIQEKTFTRWCNVHLAQRGIQLKELTRGELSDGLVLINLLEVISDKKLPRHNKHPKIMPQKLENCGISLAFIKSEGLKLVNIGPEDIVNGTPKLILGLIWTLILRYQVAGCSETESAKNVLLEGCAPRSARTCQTTATTSTTLAPTGTTARRCARWSTRSSPACARITRRKTPRTR